MDTSTELTVVSGGGSGIGRAVALKVASRGGTVLAVGRRPGPLADTAEQAPAGSVEVVAADLSTVEGATAVVDALAGRPVTGVVAAAGGQGEFKTPGRSLEQVDQAWTDALRKNLFSAVLLVEALIPHMKDADARVVLIGSTSGIDGLGGPYATAKAALNGYGRDLARRLGRRGIAANTVAPGFVQDTEFFDAGGYDLNDEMLSRAAAGTLVGRVGRSEDIADCVEWLLSRSGGWITGQVISPNGGTVFVR